MDGWMKVEEQRINMVEIRVAMKSMKSGNLGGPDEIPV